MMTGRVQLRGVRIELDDAGMVVERNGITYTVLWTDVPAAPGEDDQLVEPITDVTPCAPVQEP